MSSRQSFDIESFVHANPIPCVTRIGPLVISSVIVGRDPGASTVPDDVESQITNLFHHTGEMLRAAGADWRHVARMNFFLPSLDQRAVLNGPWLEHFPDPDSRPARHTEAVSGPVAKCDFLAYVEG